MNLKEYIKIQTDKGISLETVYEEMLRLGYKSIDIYLTINDVIIENINKTINDYLKKKNE